MTTPFLEKLDAIPGTADDIFENRDDEMLDGILEASGAAPPATRAAADPTAAMPGGGKLLEEASAAKVFKIINREVQSQERLARNRDEEGKHWSRIRRGVQFSILEKSEDQALYRAILPPGVEDTQQPIPNKVLDLCNKQVSQILVDPPLPNPKPDGDSEKNRGAMDLAKRFLRADGDVSGTNDSELYRRVLTMNRTRKSSFVFVWVDPTGGGWRPKQRMAHPRAIDASTPLMGPKLGPDGAPVLDEQQQPMLERTTDPVLRYVADVDDEATGETREVFTEHPAEAAREWLPKHRAAVLLPNQVRTLPPTATVVEAHSIILLMWEPLSEARKRFPEVLGGMSQAELKQLTIWRPKRWKAIVPEAHRPRTDGLDESGDVSGDTLLFWYHKFCRIAPDYPDGAEIAVTGASRNGSVGVLLGRDTLREDVQTDDDVTVPVLMDPPIAQFRALIDDEESGDPFGLTPVSLFGGANEIRAHLYLAALEDIDVRLHPNIYLTSASSVTREEMNRRDGTPIDVLTKDDMPTFEQRPQLPDLAPTLDRVDHEMDRLANLNETAQALDSSYSVSGEAKKVALRQAKVQLAQDWQGFINGFVQYMKIKLQLAQARLQVPQLVKIAGENAAYKARHFVGADMLGVSTVALQPGTGTMMSPAEKAQYIATFQGQKWIEPEQAAELARSSMSDDLGLQPSPHEEHINRLIADWSEGPPPEWEEAFHNFSTFPQRQQAYAASIQEMVAAFANAGVPQEQAQAVAAERVGPAPVQPPEPPTPFEAHANDEEPVVAKVRYEKLSKLMSTPEYTKWKPSWRTCVDKAYTQASYAAGIVTVRQQREAQQQQAQQAAAAQQAPKDPNAPPAYQEFIAAATKAVVAKAQSLLARETAALGASTSVEQKPSAEHVPAEIDAPEPSTVPLELHHQSMEAECDRAHEASMAETAHDNKLEQIKAQNVGKTLASAERQATRQSGAPRPEHS